jgi:hypothetical protein
VNLQEVIALANGPLLNGLAGRVARAIGGIPAAPTSAAPFEADLSAAKLTGKVTVALDKSSTPPSVTVKLSATGLELAPPPGTHWAGASPAAKLVGDAELAATLGAAVSWTAAGVITLQPNTLVIPIFGPAELHLTINECALVSGADGPAVSVTGSLNFVGVPGVNETASLNLGWSEAGISGAAHAQSGDWDVSWSGHDIVPSAVDILIPLALEIPNEVSSLSVTAGAGARIRATGARTPGGFDLTVAVEAGDAGVLTSDKPEAAALVVLGAAAAANTKGSNGAAELIALATTAGGLFATGVVDGTGHATVRAVRVNLADPGRVFVEYEAVLNARINAGPLVAETKSPVRAHVRNAVFDIDALALDLHDATLDLSDTGSWAVESPQGLFDVGAVRSGFGSSWFELDLHFAVDLGPVQVSRATLRVALDPKAPQPIQLRGFGVGIDIPGLLHGSGSLALQSAGFAASLSLEITPFQLAAKAALQTETNDNPHFVSTIADVEVDFPVPIPIANSGFGLMSVGGQVGVRRKAVSLGADLAAQVNWDPLDPVNGTKPDPDNLMFGARLIIGTLPDLGATLQATGAVAVVVPDLAVRAALDVKLLGGFGPRVIGVLVADDNGLFVGALGRFQFPSQDLVLLDARAPIEAWFPSHSGAWHVFLGSDGVTPRESPGPISVTVLPDLFGMSCEAFLMVDGQSLHNVMGVGLDLDGFSIATGFKFATTFGLRPVAWADLHVQAALGIGTTPLVIAGTGQAGGSLHLGPFSLSVDVKLNLQIGPDTTLWAHLEACGSIDLFFFEVGGCIHVDLGSHPLAKDPPPPPSPLKEATIGDPWGRATRNASALTADANAAPVAWPDSTVLLSFDPGPQMALGSTAQFTGWAYDAPTGAGGSPGQYEVHATVTSLSSVVDGTKTPDGTGVPCRWQAVDGSSTQGAGRTLALFTKNPALWATSLTDGGASSAIDPAVAARRDCEQSWRAEPAWTFGGRAVTQYAARFRLPSLPAANPLRSKVAATVVVVAEARGGGQLLIDPTSEPYLPYGAVAIAGGAVADREVELRDGTRAPGWLQLPRLDQGDPNLPIKATVFFDDPLLGARNGAEMPPTLVLLVDEGSDGPFVNDPDWEQDEQAWDRGLKLVVLTWKGQGELPYVSLTQPEHFGESATVRLVAVGGQAKDACAAADAKNEAAKQNHDDAHADVKVQPLLQPSARHRIDVTWSAKAHRLMDPPGTSSAGDTDHRYFRIADHVATDTPPPMPRLRTSVAEFHPAMLERYLHSYETDGETAWFLGDSIAAHFSSESIASVAKTYGYNVELELTRTDPPPYEESPAHSEQFDVMWARATRNDVLSPFDQHGVASSDADCPWPTSAVTASAEVPIQPRANYDVAVVLTPDETVATSYVRYRTSLPRSAFRTSRWRWPGELFAALGFGTNVDLLHVVVPPGANAPSLTEPSDATFLAARDAAGINLPPLETATRTTILWSSYQAPEVVGVLLEADEPLVRFPRFAELSLEHPNQFVRPILDRAATAALFWAATPFAADLRLWWFESFTGISWTFSKTKTLHVPSVAGLFAQEVVA